MTDISDTRKRAELRGREAVALWRIRGAVWAGWAFAILFVALSIIPLTQGGSSKWSSVAVLLILSTGIGVATERMRKGDRIAACLLLGLFVAAKLGAWLFGGESIWRGAFWTILIVGALVNGIWGTFALAKIRREAALVPPPPTRSRVPAV